MKIDAVVVSERGALERRLHCCWRGQAARVLLIDKGKYGTDMLSTHALMRGAVLQLQRWGVLPAIQAAGTPR